ncbi:S1 family peptidase [Corynebacterium caspium]|uniref:S1 family peptidase n=1 Tax=Corynebacterium caspium TaxID=234828 RepID=UPI00035E4597|nr:S1 family peptidase [Corynebacterium caspium]WKD58936.1 hypothetical protein CCASP_02645 [Corynebacterium caspium DSM 44850]
MRALASRCVSTAAVIAVGSITIGSSATAFAQTAPEETTNTAVVYQKAQQDAAKYGINLPKLPREFAEAIDAASPQAATDLENARQAAATAAQNWFQSQADLQTTVRIAFQGATLPTMVANSAAGTTRATQATQAAIQMPEFKIDPQIAARNYLWVTDPISQILAGKLPGSGPVLHRVGGSWFDAPRIPEEAKEAAAAGKILMGAGTPIYLSQNTMCTLTAVGTDATGKKWGITAAHCAKEGDPVASADMWQLGAAGKIVYRDTAADYAIIEFAPNVEFTSHYNGVNAQSIGDNAVRGEQLCKFGVASGWSCGITWIASSLRFTSHAGAMPGDSGAPVMRGNQLVGMVNGGILPFPELAYHSPLQGAAFMPTQMTPMSRVLTSLNADPQRPGAGFTLWNEALAKTDTATAGTKTSATAGTKAKN